MQKTIYLTPKQRDAFIKGDLWLRLATSETDSTYEPERITEDNIDNIVSGFLSEFGGNFHFAGVKYIKYAIKLMYFNPNLKSVTRDIYPLVAKKFNSTSNSVERCIRNWIECSTLQRKFTNKKFLYFLIEELKKR